MTFDKEPSARWLFRKETRRQTRHESSPVVAATTNAPDREDIFDEEVISETEGRSNTSDINTNGVVATFSSPFTLLMNGNLNDENTEEVSKDVDLEKEVEKGDVEDADSGLDNDADERPAGNPSAERSLPRREVVRKRPALPEGHNMLSWTPSDVRTWLGTIGIRTTVIQLFTDRQVDGRMLAAFTDNDLEHDLGIESRYARRAILLSIDENYRNLAEGRESEPRAEMERPPGIEEPGIQGEEELPPPYVGDN
ncbi:hypothetical protein HDU97_001987 [Phlyctochytrium planicorne]|nr:hypothetical protein HDU97_001987 [Phlyctochytrium planicorne]